MSTRDITTDVVLSHARESWICVWREWLMWHGSFVWHDSCSWRLWTLLEAPFHIALRDYFRSGTKSCMYVWRDAFTSVAWLNFVCAVTTASPHRGDQTLNIWISRSISFPEKARVFLGERGKLREETVVTNTSHVSLRKIDGSGDPIKKIYLSLSGKLMDLEIQFGSPDPSVCLIDFLSAGASVYSRENCLKSWGLPW